MQKVILLAIVSSFAFSMNLVAEPVGVNRASVIARNFAGKDVCLCGMGQNAKSRINATPMDEAFHIFNSADGNGFVIVSGESEMPEIVAYSFSSSIDMDKAPQGFFDYLNAYTELVESVRNGETVDFQARRRSEAKEVKPLCKTQWGQDAPYNTLCPKINGETCPAGCVATAMAQIMHYYSWPKVGRGIRTYDSGISGVGLLSSNFAEHEYKWDAMKLTTSENLASEEASALVAQLCFDCGVGARMDYGLDGSAANDDYAMEAFFTYLGYKGSTIHMDYRQCYQTVEDWEDLICSELDAGRPVLYAGYTIDDDGHEFLVDGYDCDRKFHVNWGWDGSADGYFSISILKPSKSLVFSQYNTVIAGIEPDYSGKDFFRAQSRVYMRDVPTVAQESVKQGSVFVVKYADFYNVCINARTWYIGAGIFDKDENLVKVINARVANNKEQLFPDYGIRTYDVACIIPKALDDGEYVIKAVFREDGYDDWLLPYMYGGAHLNALPVVVENGTAYFKPLSSGIEYVNANDNKEISQTEYYDLQGRRVMTPSAGSLYIYKVYYSDQSSTSKVVLAK